MKLLTDKRSRFDAARKVILAAFGLVVILAALKLRSLKPEDQNLTARHDALVQATELLLAPPASIRIPAPQMIANANYRFATAPSKFATDGGISRPSPDESPADEPPATRSSQLNSDALQRRSAPTGGNSGTTSALTSRAADDTPEPATKSQTSAQPAALHGKPRSAIPASIEDGSLAHPSGDALKGMTVRGALRVVDGIKCPFRLLATRTNGGHSLAQIQELRTSAAVSVSPGWLEIGDSPGQGWRILKVDPAEVLLMDPQGNSVRLKSTIREDGSGTSPAARSSGTAAVTR